MDDEERTLAEVRAWIVDLGFDVGELNHEIVGSDGSVEAILDLAWPRGLQMEFSEPVALLLNEPLDVYQVAVNHGYRPFTSVAGLRGYATELEATGNLEPTAA